MFDEDNLLPISALQHLLFCERQCVLIHVERQWAENRLTVEGQHLHEKAHDGQSETRDGVRIARGVPLRSFSLGLFGVADVVEFRGDKSAPFPIEYKRGKPKIDDCDRVQLCAQVLCFEEMLNTEIPKAAIFYGQTRRREDIDIDRLLRRKVQEAARKLHELFDVGVTPPAVLGKHCKNCSLSELCLPKAVGEGKSVKRYLGQMLSDQREGTSM